MQMFNTHTVGEEANTFVTEHPLRGLSWCFDEKSPRKYYAFPDVEKIPPVNSPLPEIDYCIFHHQEKVFTRTLVVLKNGLFAYLVQCDEKHLGDSVGFYEIHLANSIEDLCRAYTHCNHLYKGACCPLEPPA